MDGKIRGEYWITDSGVDFADGDIGDKNHEMIAAEQVFYQFASAIESLAEEFEIEVNFERYGDLDYEQITKVLDEIFEILTVGKEDEEEPDPSKLMSNQQADAFIMSKLECNDDAYAILRGGGDARLYAQEHLGWIAIRSNNVELYGYDNSRQSEIADAIREVLYHEEGQDDNQINPADVEIAIYDHKSGRSWYTTLEDLEKPEVTARPNQQPQTTYNKPLAPLPDEEENKYAQQGRKSQPNKWTAAARKAKVIGPGQDLWRRTSEGVLIMRFKEWLEINYAESLCC